MTIAYNISAWNRRRKWQLFLDHIKTGANTTVLDVGFNNEEYSETDNYLEKKYPHKKNITALGIEKDDIFKKKYPEVKSVLYKGGVFPFTDKQFDVCWSNAVIEHVGSREKQVEFLHEIKRVSHKAFITTPNKLFPVEVHTRIPFLHLLLSKKCFDKFLKLIGKKWAVGDYMNLISHRQLKQLLSEAGITEYTIIKNKLLGFTLDFVIVF